MANRKIFFHNREKGIDSTIRDLDNESYVFFNRSRLHLETTEFDLDLHHEAKNHSVLALNEIFVAEKNVAKTSTF